MPKKIFRLLSSAFTLLLMSATHASAGTSSNQCSDQFTVGADPVSLSRPRAYSEVKLKNISVRTYSESLTYVELSQEIEKLRTLWTRKGKDQKGKSTVLPTTAAVALFHIRGIDNTTIYVFSDPVQMNTVFNRASTFAEEGRLEYDKEHVEQARSFGAGGHDLKSQDLLDFWYWFQEVRDIVAFNGTKADDTLLDTENETWKRVMLPILFQHQSIAKVMIAVSLAGKPLGVLSHEVLHAQYFTNPKFAKAIQDFWLAMPSDVKNKVRDMLAATGLYSRDNEDLMMNEFQAYLLEEGFKTSLFGPLAVKYKKALEKFLTDRGLTVRGGDL